MRKVVRNIPEGAVLIYPHELVHLMFGHANIGGTRKEMSRQGVSGLSGYEVDDIHAIFGADESGRLDDGSIIGDMNNYL